jgi:transposase
MNEVTTIGLDLAKNVFKVHGVDASGRAVVRRQLTEVNGRDLFSMRTRKASVLAITNSNGGFSRHPR